MSIFREVQFSEKCDNFRNDNPQTPEQVKLMMPNESRTSLLDLGEQIQRLSARVEELEQRNQELEAENKRLKELLHEKGESKSAKAPQFKEDYSVEKHKGKSKRGHQATGRRSQVEKLSVVSQNVNV